EPCRVPPVLVADDEALMLEQRIVGEFMGPEPPLEDLAKLVSDFHSGTCKDRIPAEDYLSRHRDLVARSPIEPDLLKRIAAQLEGLTVDSVGRPQVPVTQVH